MSLKAWENIFDIACLMLLAIAFTFFCGCGQLQIVTEQDNIDSVYIPANVVAIQKDAREIAELFPNKDDYFAGYYYEAFGTYYVFYSDYCTLIHELDHVKYGHWHGDRFDGSCGISKAG